MLLCFKLFSIWLLAYCCGFQKNIQHKKIKENKNGKNKNAKGGGGVGGGCDAPPIENRRRDVELKNIISFAWGFQRI